MNRIVAVPLVAVGGVRFGMKRDEVRQILGNAREFRKNQFSRNTTDDFGFCHVFYNADNECEAIEVFPEVEILVNGQIIMPSSLESIMGIAQDLHEDDGCLISESLSIGITISSGNIESILFGCQGYYTE